jgi:hypothetical protein
MSGRDHVNADACTDLDRIRGMALTDATDATRRAAAAVAAAVAAATHGEPDPYRRAALATAHATLVDDRKRLRIALQKLAEHVRT